ncbi:hypothetical protein L1987_09064 [Smallanthus sonchifolius]|uniref:Uncharacterized protein n=1 Tax=Smallanthus sonchifolius TaxID=185202 RepID=A0ACB9JMY1_9ASTR|nr:hypothetical protein L1987_09064 [Smallanthus sonchifolius]
MTDYDGRKNSPALADFYYALHVERHFTFEPKVRAALAREFTELMKASLPELLAEALKKVNDAGGSDTVVGTPNTEAVNAPLTRGCDYKSFKACDPPILTGKKDAVATFDTPPGLIIGTSGTTPGHYGRKENRLLHLGIVRTYVKANAPTTYESVVELNGVVFDDLALNMVSIEEPKKKLSFPAKRSGGKLFGARDKQARVGEISVSGKCGGRHAGERRIGSNWCYKCGKTGHYSHECMQGIKCYNCGISSHMSRECTKPRMVKLGKGKAMKRKKRGPEQRLERTR